MLANLSKRENVRMWLSAIDAYPLQLLQNMGAEELALLQNIGPVQFDELLREVSFCARNGRLEADPDWNARIRRGDAAKDADSLAGFFILYHKAIETSRSIHPSFFPYAITRTPSAGVICYNRLQGMELAEYAAELIDNMYSRPKYLSESLPSEQDLFARMVVNAEPPPY